MLFNSIEFFVFLPIVYALYRCGSLRFQNLMLLAASYVFYGWWDQRFLFLIVISTAVDYCSALLIHHGRVAPRGRIIASAYVLAAALGFVAVRWSAIGCSQGTLSVAWNQLLAEPLGVRVLIGTLAAVAIANASYPWITSRPEPLRRRVVLVISIVANLTILGFFKYFNFFVDSAEGLAQAVGLDANLLRLDIVLPVGISFYTFQTMSYTIDVYRKLLKPTHRFLDFALYVAYFPQLVAGPIERGKDLLPRLLAARTLTIDQTARGLQLILYGLFKKVAIADGVAHSVNQVFNSSGQVTGTDASIATVLFAVQIYCDFSGYTDIARGTSKLLGIEIRRNFNLPYFSTSPREFWSRWHISLSTWLRDYLYIPLGGNREGKLRTYRNLMITMLLGGLWHGAAWHFVSWGLYHGVLLSIHRAWCAWRGERVRNSVVAKLPAMAFFFLLTLYGWLLFRAQSFGQIASFTMKMATDWGHIGFHAAPPRLSAVVGVPLLVVMEITRYLMNERRYQRRLPRIIRGGLYAAIIFVLLLSGSNEPSDFIYFAF